MTRRAVLSLLTAAYLALIAWATLGTVSWDRVGWESAHGVLSPSTWVDPDTWAFGSQTEFAANIAMFVPVGALFALLAGPRRWVLALASGVALSAAIEIVQLPMDDRISDPRDLVANSIGAAIGLAVVVVGWLVAASVRAVRRRLHPASPAAGSIRATPVGASVTSSAAHSEPAEPAGLIRAAR